MASMLVLAAACGGGGGAPAGTVQPGGGSPVASVAGAAVTCTGSGGEAVAIQGFAFDPASITVAVGGTVTWTNNDTAPHTVTFNEGGPECGGQLANGASATAQFAQGGSFAYFCRLHPTMKGTVVVQ